MFTLNSKARYLIAGLWNTLFGYFCFIYLYIVMKDASPTVVIAIIANIVSISMAFLSYKLFVFQTKGNWINEYFKCYLVYGGLAIINILMNWAFLDYFDLSPWLSQAICIPITIVISYFSHLNFTFRKSST